MLNTDPTHTHTYDTHGKMTCCSLEEKIYAHAEAQLKTEAHQDGDGHDHEHSAEAAWRRQHLPVMVSLMLLLTAIVLDNWLKPGWFSGWLRVVWYVAAYLPVALPVILEAVGALRKARFSLNLL